MKKPTLEEIRRANILDNLIHYKEYDEEKKKAYFKDKVSQKEIGRLVNWFFIDKGKDPYDPINWPVKPIQISKTLKSLEEDGLIIREPQKTPGKGPAQNLISLIKNYTTLNKIIKEYNNPTFEYHYRVLLGINLLNSHYGYDLVNMDLVEAILKGPYQDLSMEPEEKIRLLDLIKISPSALFTFIDPYSDTFLTSHIDYFKEEGVKIEQFKKALFLFLLNAVGRDFTYLSPHSTPWKIDYEIKVKFSDWEKEDKINYEPYLEDELFIDKNSIKMTCHSTRGGTIFSTYYKPYKEKPGKR